MRRVILALLITFVLSAEAFAYVRIEPQYLKSSDSTSYELVNETLAIIFNRVKPKISTNKYPKYFHDYTVIKDDGTQSKNYYYVKNGKVELLYAVDTNELKYIALVRPELQKCRIMYDYPSGNLHAVQIYVSGSEYFIFGPDGKYVDYSPYVREVHEKVQKNWKVPSRKEVEKLAKGQKDLLVQIAITVGKDGRVKKTVILKSSKIKALDENAQEAVKSSSPFKPFPENFFNEEMVVTLNFNFSL